MVLSQKPVLFNLYDVVLAPRERDQAYLATLNHSPGLGSDATFSTKPSLNLTMRH